MANNITDGQEFCVLGFNVKFRADSKENINVEAIVNLVRDEVKTIKKHSPKLSDGEVAILAALELAKNKIRLEGEYKANVNALHTSTHNIINTIEEVLSPPKTV